MLQATHNFALMKSGLLIGGMLLAGTLQGPSAAAQQFGVSFGLNYQQLSDLSFNSLETRFKSKEGWHVGVWFEFAIGPIGIRPGLRYVDAGQLFDGINETFPATRDQFDVSMVEIPFVFRYGIKAPVIGPYVFVGPVLRFPSFTDKVISNDLAPMSIAGEAGVGLQITLGGLKLYPEVAYTFGFTNFIEDEIVIDFVTLTPEGSQRLNSAMVRLAVGF